MINQQSYDWIKFLCIFLIPLSINIQYSFITTQVFRTLVEVLFLLFVHSSFYDSQQLHSFPIWNHYPPPLPYISSIYIKNSCFQKNNGDTIPIIESIKIYTHIHSHIYIQWEKKQSNQISHATLENAIDYTIDSHHLDTGYAEVKLWSHLIMPL